MIKRVLSVVFAAALLVGLFSVFPVAANATSGMKVSQACIDRIKKIEGFHAIPYWDYSQWTVGFGSTCPADKLEEYKAKGIPMAEAERLMKEQLARFEECVNEFSDSKGIALNQGQFDALVSMTYNLGTGILQNGTSRVYQAITQGLTGNDLIFAFSIYCTAGGEFLPGLMRRRLVEANMYINSDYDDYAPENYCYVLYDANGGTRDVVAQGYDCNLVAKPLSVPTYSGYTFVGWYTAAKGGTRVTTLDETTAGMTLYAHWEKGENTAETSKNVEVTVTAEAVNVRIGPGVEYAICAGVFKDEKLQITGVTVVDGIRWGKFSKGWICLQHTNYAALTGDHDEPVQDEKPFEQVNVPIMATVLYDKGVPLYNGPHTTYPQLKTLAKGTVVEITEVFILFDTMWGKCADGWVQINLRLQLHDSQRLAHSFDVTINYQYYLNVRSGPGTNYNKVTELANGTVVEIVAVEYVGDVPWGRCSLGWINMDYTSFNEDMLEIYRSHIYGQWYVEKEASCIADGAERRDCSYCGHHESRVIPKGSHSYGQWYVSEPGNCETPSTERRDCEFCDHYETRQNALGGHVFGDWYVYQEGDCLTPSTERRDCQLCGSYETRESQTAAHKYEAWIVSNPSTCTVAGEQWRICLVCGHYDEEDLPLAEHSYGQWYETLAPTMEAEGEERRDCAVCGAFETRALAKTEHIYDAWYVVTAPGCETEGLEQRDCQHCEQVQTRVIEATGHDMGQWQALTAPTCTEVGTQFRVCQNCNLLENQEVEALGHRYAEWIVLVETTCTTDGEKCRMCDVCAFMDVQTTPATGHNFSNWITLSQATCTTAGEQCRACLICSFVEMKAIEPLDHSYGEWYTVTEATCGKPGQQRRDCAACGHSQTQELVANDHTLGDWYVHRQASCGVDGEERRQCSKCDYVETRTIAAQPHNFGVWYTDKQPTCTEPGQERRDCSICGGKETKPIDAAGHSFGQWYEVSTGLERRDCDKCEEFETRTTGAPDMVVEKVYGIVDEYYVQVRSGAGSGYSAEDKLFYGERVEILEQRTVSGENWGRIGEGRWVLLTGQLTLETVEEVLTNQSVTYATVTCTLLNVRPTTSETSVAVAYLTRGDRVKILEQKQDASGKNWGRIEGGWVVLTGNANLETVVESVGTTQIHIQILGVITYDGLNVRSGCGTSYGKVGTLPAGTQVEILEIGLSGSQVWGRYSEGWFRLDGYVTLSQVRQELVNGHEYGQWYVANEPTCTQDGQRRRDCKLCDGYESEVIPAVGHSYSDWTLVEESTCVKQGVEAHICQRCMSSEIRPLPLGDHSYDQWYTVTEATATTPGLQQRDCRYCDANQTRTTEFVPSNVTKTYGIVTGYTYVNIRAGADSKFALLGQLNYGDKVEVLEQKNDSSGRLWARISEEGWVCVTGYLTLQTVTESTAGPTVTTVTKTYGTVTASSLNMRSGVGASYDLLGVLNRGAKVEILEQKTDEIGRTWGRVSENCWICLTGYVDLETVTEEVRSDAFVVTLRVNTSRLHIYSSTSTSSTGIGYLIFDAKVDVLEVKVVNGQMWARILQGWIKGDDLK